MCLFFFVFFSGLKFWGFLVLLVNQGPWTLRAPGSLCGSHFIVISCTTLKLYNLKRVATYSAFSQTMDMLTSVLQLHVSWGQVFYFVLWQCCVNALVRFRYKTHLVRVRKTQFSWVEIPLVVVTNTAGDLLRFLLKYPALNLAGNCPEFSSKTSSSFTLYTIPSISYIKVRP